MEMCTVTLVLKVIHTSLVSPNPFRRREGEGHAFPESWDQLDMESEGHWKTGNMENKSQAQGNRPEKKNLLPPFVFSCFWSTKEMESGPERGVR